MEQIANNFKSPLYVVDFILSVVVLGLLFWLCLKIIKRKPVIIAFGVVALACIVSHLLALSFLRTILWSCLLVSAVIVAFVNIGEIRPLLVNPLKNGKKKKESVANFDREAFFKTINDTINNLSKSKTGALLTFEKKMPLSDFMKSGTMINAPVSAELLETIFYEGTRLHDGAVIIKGNMIVCASVYYTPTTQALTGKYGARHRAALGISEMTDALTVVVSEETGRVSFAYNGMLEPVKLDEFPKLFKEAMLDAYQD